MSEIPAEIKKKENIAEYIIHMYQTEDLVLNYNFNLDDILNYVLQHMTSEEQTLKTLLLWYADVIDNMQSEEIIDASKRLQSTQALVDELSDLHRNLLIKDGKYKDLYMDSEVDIQRNIKLSNGAISEPIQICINGIYGMLLLKLNGKKIPSDQEARLEKFGAVLAYLSQEYKRLK